MAVVVKCPNPECGRSWTADDASPSRFAVCPACQREVELRVDTPALVHAQHETAGRKSDGGKMPLRVGRYVVRSRLGWGGFGAVYQAYDPVLEREVALKVPHPGTLNDEQSVTRFLREAKAAAKLHHANIVPIFDTGREGDDHFIASAFIAGRPLSALLKEDRLEIRRAVRFAIQLLEALAHAHENGVIHRDVKPSNVLVDKEDRLHLTDFGLAGWMTQDQSRVTRSGAVFGTPAYMSPEQARGETKNIGPASDQYAAGISLYEMLTGQLPFSGPPHTVLYQINYEEPAKPSKLRPEIDRQLEVICLKAMAKKPAQRYGSCSACAAALRAWLDKPPPLPLPLEDRPPLKKAARAPARARRPIPLPPERSKSNHAVAWTIGILVALLFLLLVVAALNDLDRSTSTKPGTNDWWNQDDKGKIGTMPSMK